MDTIGLGCRRRGGDERPDCFFTLGIVMQFSEPPGGALITMAFVDGTTGEVLWERRTGTSPMLPPDFSKKELAELVEDLFAPFMK